jgi:precorrin-6B C5,15-methyltransferase / cobalt-precorrin-6B C5,C15-methyltransferase
VPPKINVRSASAMSESAMPGRWLTILGIGEDGLEGLSPAARTLISQAHLVVGGQRHLELARAAIRGRAMPWPKPISEATAMLGLHRGQPVVALASGDPFEYGVGSLLAEAFTRDELQCIPSPSAFSLACARLGWPRQSVKTLSFCGRALAPLVLALQPGSRIMALSADATTPAAVAELLTTRGFGASRVHVLQFLGGAKERIFSFLAREGCTESPGSLNMLAIEAIAAEGAAVIPLCAGLDDALFEHDGQLTKREIRAITLSSLAPRAGERLWDIGCGCGSISIEWLMSHEANSAIAIEANAERAARTARNALALGTPQLHIVHGEAPACLDGLPRPNAVFLGGGAHVPQIVERAWNALLPGGRLVANAVVLETEAALSKAQVNHGGTLTRIRIERFDALGEFHAFRPALPITQWAAVKP